MKRAATLLALCICISLIALAMASEDSAPKYYGSKKSDKYHSAGCRYVAKIKDENLRTFHSVKEARDAGYVPCKVCKPPQKDPPPKKP